jgi:hypothetical protein
VIDAVSERVCIRPQVVSNAFVRLPQSSKMPAWTDDQKAISVTLQLHEELLKMSLTSVTELPTEFCVSYLISSILAHPPTAEVQTPEFVSDWEMKIVLPAFAELLSRFLPQLPLESIQLALGFLQNAWSVSDNAEYYVNSPMESEPSARLTRDELKGHLVDCFTKGGKSFSISIGLKGDALEALRSEIQKNGIADDDGSPPIASCEIPTEDAATTTSMTSAAQQAPSPHSSKGRVNERKATEFDHQNKGDFPSINCNHFQCKDCGMCYHDATLDRLARQLDRKWTAQYLFAALRSLCHNEGHRDDACVIFTDIENWKENYVKPLKDCKVDRPKFIVTALRDVHYTLTVAEGKVIRELDGKCRQPECVDLGSLSTTKLRQFLREHPIVNELFDCCGSHLGDLREYTYFCYPYLVQVDDDDYSCGPIAEIAFYKEYTGKTLFHEKVGEGYDFDWRGELVSMFREDFEHLQRNDMLVQAYYEEEGVMWGMPPEASQARDQVPHHSVLVPQSRTRTVSLRNCWVSEVDFDHRLIQLAHSARDREVSMTLRRGQGSPPKARESPRSRCYLLCLLSFRISTYHVVSSCSKPLRRITSP